ncbi:fffdb596-a682-419e-947d-cf7e28dbb15f [Thermothielavioides terrestris]|uniref:Fffdb596-a682-419e-947d-cf7e28dbb15f n=1 Tax=Thermothielavioides terrestris TaxID=2587410 RepID=A0A3S4ARB5_9PEZI|nr:fffdb596-a682-419e-947d-cf7e28dbb15f [Thermothielavioides terrestris]
MSRRNVLDFADQFVPFVPVAVQAHHLVNHLLQSGCDWGRLYGEALRGWFLANHGSDEERWFDAIISELKWRG